MDLEDQHRFTVEAWARDDASLYLSCDRCDWETRVGDGSASLRTLEERAQEHAEVCR